MPLWRLFETSKDRRLRLREEERARERMRAAEAKRARDIETDRARFRTQERKRQRQEFLIAQEAEALVQEGLAENFERARAVAIRQREKHRARTKLVAHTCIYILVGLYLAANQLISQTLIGGVVLVWCVALFWQGFQYHAEHGQTSMLSFADSDSRQGRNHKMKVKHKRGIRRLSSGNLRGEGDYNDAYLEDTDKVKVPKRY